jgi:hypothetical protein
MPAQCRVTRHLAAVRWSRGLRAVVLGPTAEAAKTDVELATEDIDGEVVATMPIAAWLRLRSVGLEYVLLVAAETGGTAAMSKLIAAGATSLRR